MARNSLIALAIVIVAGVVYLIYINSTQSPAPTTTSTQTDQTQTVPTQTTPTPTPTTAPTTPQPVSVSIRNFAFAPQQISVKAGTKVTWTNNDSTAHTVTSDSGAFSSGTLNPGSSFSFVFNTPGTFSYHCSIHPSMTATVVVTQ
jgi:plastocyanin